MSSARQRTCSLDVPERLWRLYVESAVLYGMAAVNLSSKQEKRIDVIQKVVGQMLLGHKPDSPSAAVYEEPGWGR